MHRFLPLSGTLLFAAAVSAQQPAATSASPAPAPAASAAAAGDESEFQRKIKIQELTKIADDVAEKLPWSMNLDDPQYAALFPLAISTENPWWYTLGPDHFTVFKYPKSEPFRDRQGRYIKPPGSHNTAILVAEDTRNFYFQWSPPGETFSEEWRVRNKSAEMRNVRDQQRKADETAADTPDGEKKMVNLRSYLGVAGYTYGTDKPEIAPKVEDNLSFQASGDGLPGAGLWQLGTAVADVNGDGKLDVVAPTARKEIGGKPHIWLGDGKGGFSEWKDVRYPSDVSFDYGDVAVADFDRDGKADIALAMHFKGLVVLYGDGKGDFTSYFRFFDGNGFTTRALAVADYDGDKHPDIAALAELNLDPKTNRGVVGRMIRVFLYRDRTRWDPRDEGTTPHLIGDQLATADLNADGRPDLVSSSHVHGFTSLLHLNDGKDGWKIWKEKLIGDAYYWGVSAGDMNGDGRGDVVLSFMVVRGSKKNKLQQGGIAVFHSQKDGHLGEPQFITFTQTSMPYLFVHVADLDKDGRNDVIAGDYVGHFRIFLQRKKGEYVEEESPEIAAIPAAGARVADVNGDGLEDLIVNFSSEKNGGMIACYLQEKRKKR